LGDTGYTGPDLALVFFKIGTDILHVFLEIQADIDGKPAFSIPIEHGFLEIDDLTGSIRKKLPKIASILLKTFLLQEFLLQSAEQILEFLIQGFIHYRESTSSSQILPAESAGIFQSPRGPSPTEPTFTPSGMQLRLNCWVKKRQ
jgi:hypothetical protein